MGADRSASPEKQTLAVARAFTNAADVGALDATPAPVLAGSTQSNPKEPVMVYSYVWHAYSLGAITNIYPVINRWAEKYKLSKTTPYSDSYQGYYSFSKVDTYDTLHLSYILLFSMPKSMAEQCAKELKATVSNLTDEKIQQPDLPKVKAQLKYTMGISYAMGFKDWVWSKGYDLDVAVTVEQTEPWYSPVRKYVVDCVGTPENIEKLKEAIAASPFS
jgi:hypothetical protein